MKANQSVILSAYVAGKRWFIGDRLLLRNIGPHGAIFKTGGL
jgi:hypothetical protein